MSGKHMMVCMSEYCATKVTEQTLTHAPFWPHVHRGGHK